MSRRKQTFSHFSAFLQTICDLEKKDLSKILSSFKGTWQKARAQIKSLAGRKRARAVTIQNKE